MKSNELKNQLDTNVKLSTLWIVVMFTMAFADILTFTPYLHYLFFATIEVVSMLLIIWYSWKWKKPEDQKSS